MSSIVKKVVVHLGPHKTGTTSIQKSLHMNKDALRGQNALFLSDSKTHSAAMALANENYDEATSQLEEINRRISEASEATIVVSQEDFCGQLIGRTGSRRIYPKLTKNMRIISRALRKHEVYFVFFSRQEESWLRSCYLQNLRYRTRFCNFVSFQEHFEPGFSWEKKLAKPYETFGDDLIVVPYEVDFHSGISAICKIAGISIDLFLQSSLKKSENSSPNSTTIEQWEYVNRHSEFKKTAWFSKKLLEANWRPQTIPAGDEEYNEWPPKIDQKTSVALPALSKRTHGRVTRQDVNDVLPPENIDLETLKKRTLPEEFEFPSVPRYRMEDQSDILMYHLRGKTHLAHLNALVISYLRRDTELTKKARYLFHRIWEEQGLFLINELSTRWLISTLQTFLDHGKNEAQRLIGSSGYFYANLLKIGEGERAIEGREADAKYDQGKPQTKNLFRGLDRFNVGGTDLMLNTNALALEMALKDDVAGLVLQEFLLRVKESNNMFSRLDSARKDLEMDTPGFLDTWSFFEK